MHKRIQKRQTPSTYGFTIVELLIVIVVIGILAAITVVAYNSVQQRARDAQRRSDVAQIVKAFQLWSTDTGNNFNSVGAGAGGQWIGWFDAQYSPYPSVKNVLVTSGYLHTNVVDPINTKTLDGKTHAYMVAPCTSDTAATHRVLLARLEQPPAQPLAEQLGGVTCTNGIYISYTSSPYNMNYARMVQISG